MLSKHLERNPDELKKIHKLISVGGDHPVLMINENAYTHESGYPDGEPYKRYMAGLESVVHGVGGAILWRVPVLGNPVGAAARVDEILGIWYPGHQAYLDVPSAQGGEENYRLRALCVKRALIHRCPGETFQPTARTTGAATDDP
jgi:hypothetical protein